MDSDRIEGKAKEVEGELTGDESREAEGEIQGKWGEVKDKADDVWEDAKDKAGDLVDRDEETAAARDVDALSRRGPGSQRGTIVSLRLSRQPLRSPRRTRPVLRDLLGAALVLGVLGPARRSACHRRCLHPTAQ